MSTATSTATNNYILRFTGTSCNQPVEFSTTVTATDQHEAYSHAADLYEGFTLTEPPILVEEYDNASV